MNKVGMSQILNAWRGDILINSGWKIARKETI